MIITLPLPAKELRANARVHWAVKHIKTKNARAMAETMGRASRARFTGKVLIRPVFYFAKKRRRDGDNLVSSLKAYIDGLRDAGVIEDDSTEHIEWLDPRIEIHVLNPRLELHITSLEQREAA